MSGSEQGIEEKRLWRTPWRLLRRRWRLRATRRGRILSRQLACGRGHFIIAGRAAKRRVRGRRAGRQFERSPPPAGGKQKGGGDGKHDGGEVREGAFHEQAPEGERYSR